MVRRTKRVFSDQDREAMLAALGQCRAAMVKVCTKSPIGGPDYVNAGLVMAALDDAAGRITGDRSHFHLRSHG